MKSAGVKLMESVKFKDVPVGQHIKIKKGDYFIKAFKRDERGVRMKCLKGLDRYEEIAPDTLVHTL